MSDLSAHPLDCDAVRGELAALLYEELNAEARRRVEAHLETCPACRTELEAHRRTLRLLDQWPVPPTAPANVIPLASAARARRPRWWRPVVIGAAAAAVVFAALGLLGTSVTFSDGRLVVSVGRGTPAAQPGPDDAFEQYLPAVEAALREAIDTRLDSLLRSLDADLARLVSNEHRHRVALVQAVDEHSKQILDDLSTVVSILAKRQDEELSRAREFRAEMLAWRERVDARHTVNPEIADNEEDS
jgi:hypothetical protein